MVGGCVRAHYCSELHGLDAEASASTHTQPRQPPAATARVCVMCVCACVGLASTTTTTAGASSSAPFPLLQLLSRRSSLQEEEEEVLLLSRSGRSLLGNYCHTHTNEGRKELLLVFPHPEIRGRRPHPSFNRRSLDRGPGQEKRTLSFTL